jgi:hypothetical protein
MTQCRSNCFGFTCRSFSFGFACHELYCFKVVELVFLLLVVNYVVDLIMCVNYIGDYDLFLHNLYVLKAPHPGKQSKQVVVIKIKLLYSSVNRRI